MLNRDVGFVHQGQEVAVKLEAFPFTRYGTVPGRIKSVSTDAVDDKKLGSIYTARIALLRCLIPWFDGAIFSLKWKEAAWDKLDGSNNSISLGF